MWLSKPNVEEMERKKDVKGLINALRYKDFSVRDRAAEALSRIGESAVEPLIEVLSDKDSYARLKAAQALGKIRDPRAADPLAKAVNDENWNVRRETVLALGRIGDERAIRPLFHLLDSVSRGLLPKDLQEEVMESLIQMRKPAAEFLMQVLKDGYRKDRRIAIELLGRIGDERAVKPLTKSLNDEDTDIRKNAIEALERIGEPAVESLIQTLKEEKDITSPFLLLKDVDIIAALGNIGDKRAVEPLVQILDDRKDIRRRSVMIALGKIKDERTVDRLIRILVDKDEPQRDAAALALGFSEDTRAAEPLIQVLKDEDQQVRLRAVETLGKLRERRALEPLIQTFQDKDKSIKSEAAKALGRIGNLRTAEMIIDWLFGRNLQIGSPNELDSWIEAMLDLFGGYTALILKASVYVRFVGHDAFRAPFYHYDSKESDEAVRKLCHIHSQISNNILHKVSQKADIEVYSGSTVDDYDGSSHDFYRPFTFASQREMAWEELKRRGNPRYDPSAYLVEEAWDVTSSTSKNCEYCGAEVSMEANYCAKCGKKQSRER